MILAVVRLPLVTRLQPGGDDLTDFLPGVMLASTDMGSTFVPITVIATSGVPAGDAGPASSLATLLPPA